MEKRTKITGIHQFDFIPDRAVLWDNRRKDCCVYDKHSNSLSYGSSGQKVEQWYIDIAQLFYIQGQDAELYEGTVH